MQIIYADTSPYLITCTSSLQDLNDRILEKKDQVLMDRFRPNIIINSLVKFAEDNWSYIKIGENVLFRTVKPCER